MGKLAGAAVLFFCATSSALTYTVEIYRYSDPLNYGWTAQFYINGSLDVSYSGVGSAVYPWNVSPGDLLRVDLTSNVSSDYDLMLYNESAVLVDGSYSASSFDSVTYTVPSGVDLDALSVDVTSGTVYTTADSIVVDTDIYNAGSAACSSYTVDFRLSSNTFISVSDTLIGSVTKGSLAAGGTHFNTDTISLALASTGTWYVGIIVTATGDTNTGNNTDYDPVQITISAGSGVDLDVWWVDVTSGTTYTTADSVVVDTYIDNWGPAACPSYTVDFRLSSDTIINTSDTLIGSVTKGSLAAGGMHFNTDTISLALASAGTWYVGIIVTATGDTDTTNNTYYGFLPITISGIPSGVDLQVLTVDVTSGTTYTTADSVVVDTDVYNDGPDACSTYVAAFYLSTDALITASDTLIGSVSRGALAAGGTDSETNTVPLSSASPGTYYVGVIVTASGETDPSNDDGCDLVQITVSLSQVDLAVSSVAVSGGTSYDTSQGVTVDCDVDNLGPDGCISYAAAFYLSTDTTITTSDVFIGSVSAGPVSAMATDSFTLTIPLGLASAGTYYVGIIVAANGETDPSNNTGHDPLQITVTGGPLPPPPDDDDGVGGRGCGSGAAALAALGLGFLTRALRRREGVVR